MGYTLTQSERLEVELIRSELCKVVDMNPNTFKVHRSRGDLPFDTSPHDDATDDRNWMRYSIHDAARIIAAQALCAQGVTWKEAAEIIRSRSMGVGESKLIERLNPARLGTGQDLMVARLEFLTEDNKEPEFYRRHDIVDGTVEEIAGFAARVPQANRLKFPHSPPFALASMVMASMTRSYAIARARMEKLGITAEDERRQTVWEDQLRNQNSPET